MHSLCIAIPSDSCGFSALRIAWAVESDWAPEYSVEHRTKKDKSVTFIFF